MPRPSRSSKTAGKGVDTIDSGIEETGCRERLRGSILRFLAFSILALVIGAVLFAVPAGRGGAFEIGLWTVLLIAAFIAFALRNPQLFRRPDGSQVCRFEAANMLTAVRVFMVPPVIVLLNRGYILHGALLWLLAELTDVADGFVARRFRQETDFGLMVDPVGDIMATIAVFTWLFVNEGIPSWLFALLVARYVQFFAGLAVLSLAGRLPELHATLAGKIAGVVQGAVIMFFLLRAALGHPVWMEPYNRILFPVLGAAFLSVIVSQTVIGMRAVWNRDAL